MHAIQNVDASLPQRTLLSFTQLQGKTLNVYTHIMQRHRKRCRSSDVQHCAGHVNEGHRGFLTQRQARAFGSPALHCPTVNCNPFSHTPSENRN